MPEAPIVKIAQSYLEARERLSDLKDELVDEFRKTRLQHVKVNGWTINYKHKESNRLVLKEDAE